MITAKEARNLTEKTFTYSSIADLRTIEEDIKRCAKSGYYRCIRINGYIEEKTIKHLNSIGYKVTTWINQNNEYCFEINWKEN